MWTSFQLGYGLTERMSAYLNGGASSDAFFRGVDRSFALGGYGNVLDTRIVDLDLFLDFGLSGNTLTEAAVGTGLELNVDLGHFGVFATAWEVMSGRAHSTASALATDLTTGAERVFDTELGLGVHWIVAEGHEFLMLYDSSLHHVPETGQGVYEIGGVGAGYNVLIDDGVELINEVKCDIPEGGESFALGVSTGILATLP